MKIVYRVIENINCNDFNNELNYRIIKYEIDFDNKRMRTCGWNDWHEIKDDYYNTLEEAEKKLNELKGKVEKELK